MVYLSEYVSDCAGMHGVLGAPCQSSAGVESGGFYAHAVCPCVEAADPQRLCYRAGGQHEPHCDSAANGERRGDSQEPRPPAGWRGKRLLRRRPRRRTGCIQRAQHVLGRGKSSSRRATNRAVDEGRHRRRYAGAYRVQGRSRLALQLGDDPGEIGPGGGPATCERFEHADAERVQIRAGG